METREGNLPQRIWCLWFQGFDEAPRVVRACLNSWQRYNVDWDIVRLTRTNVDEYCGADIARFSFLPPQQLSDLIRLRLLLRYGGVWVDATCLALRPLDEWLAPCMEAGWFAFSRPARDRLISNWFIAALPRSPVLERLSLALEDYFLRVRAGDGSPLLKSCLSRALAMHHRTTRLWFCEALLRRGMFPYYAFHYMFADLVARDERVAASWQAVPRVPAAVCHSLQEFGLFRPATEGFGAGIGIDAPLYKLRWKFAAELLRPGSVLDHVLQVEEARG